MWGMDSRADPERLIRALAAGIGSFMKGAHGETKLTCRLPAVLESGAEGLGQADSETWEYWTDS